MPDSKILGWASSIYIYIFKKLINLFLNVLGLCHCTWGLLLVAHRLLIVVGSLVTGHKLYLYGLLELWRTGLAALRRVGSSRPRDVTRVSCVSYMGRQILYC